jgi:uncharacterized phage protein (TIGR02216 family)
MNTKPVEARPFPWAEAIAFGLGVLRLPPEAFWLMTPRELAFAMRGLRGDVTAPLTRRNVDDLMRRFPDDRPDPRHSR